MGDDPAFQDHTLRVVPSSDWTLELYLCLGSQSSLTPDIGAFGYITGGIALTLIGKDLEDFELNRIDKIKTEILERWNDKDEKGRHKPKPFGAYDFFFKEFLTDLRKDFLTGVAYYRDLHGEQVSVKNDEGFIESAATICGLAKSKVAMHLDHKLKVAQPSWLIDIPAWDGVDRLRTICFSTEVLNVSQECFYQHVLAWGAGIFARAKDSYFQNHALILRGNQGIGKDFFIKTICKGFGPYLSTWTNTRDEREIAMLMERALVLNIPEFDNTHKAEIALLKAIITKAEASYRKPYAADARTIKLRTSFISSANVEFLLRDSTGNRRYLIFHIDKFGLINKFDEFDSLQIAAQFKDAFERGVKVDEKHSDAMAAYIQSQTPPNFEDQVFEAWNSEILTGHKFKGEPPGSWVSASRASDVFEKLKKEFGIGRNHLSVLLHNRGCRQRKETGTFYRAMTNLRVVKSD